jgi:hypothetical protein
MAEIEERSITGRVLIKQNVGWSIVIDMLREVQMARLSFYAWGAMMLLLVAVSPSLITSTASPQNPSTAQSTASSQDKAKACNDLADKKGLKDSDRKTFMQNCLQKAANSGTSSNVSQQDKATVCKNIADKKGLSGADRRSFLKDCMNKANPR